MRKPFEIFSIPGFTAGTVGICKMPISDGDFTAINTWHPDHIISMTTKQEFLHPDFETQIRSVCAQWHHCPIVDFGAPNTDLTPLLEILLSSLNNGQRILAHCMGGQGRSGMLIMKLLVEQGEPAKDALARIRTVRPYAVETKQQELWASNPI